jgi:hypothetical protein
MFAHARKDGTPQRLQGHCTILQLNTGYFPLPKELYFPPKNDIIFPLIAIVYICHQNLKLTAAV